MRKRVEEICKGLSEFNFEPAPAFYKIQKLSKKEKVTLDNGDEYEGEWNKKNQMDGKGVLVYADGI